jgi:hypothetical protein
MTGIVPPRRSRAPASNDWAATWGGGCSFGVSLERFSLGCMAHVNGKRLAAGEN